MKAKNIWVILSLAVSAVSCSNGDEEANLQAVALDMKESIDNLNHAIPSLQTIITKWRTESMPQTWQPQQTMHIR